MGILAIGFAGWFLKDGAISYPKSRAHGFEEFRAENPTITETDVVEFEANADPKERKAWQEFAHHYDFKTGPEIVTQFVMAVLISLAGLVLLSIPVRSRGRWIESTDTGITSSWGQSLNFDQVVTIDKRKWRDKGIAKVAYVDNNRRRKFVIDDYKFDRYPTDAILYELEQHAGHDKIINGAPEPPPGAGETEPAEEPHPTGELS
jgi:hypothetical protein